MSKIIQAVIALVALVVLAFGVVMGAVTSSFNSMANSAQCITTPGALPESVPQPLNSIFTQAAAEWGVDPLALASIYRNENPITSDEARSDESGGYREPPPPYGDGEPWQTSFRSAEGPFQFLPGTFRAYQNSNPANQPGSVWDLTDAAYAAAHYLADLGATSGTPLGDPANPSEKPTIVNALVSYHSGPGFTQLGPMGQMYAQDGFAEYQRLSSEGSHSGVVNDCEAFMVAPASATEGYPNTDHLACVAGTDTGIHQTAKGNTVRICNVRGITVNASISDQVEAMLAAAPPELGLQGTGFRTVTRQAQLREQNCGPGQYNIWKKPSGQCRPPTAIPGESEHEQGLAVDLSSNGVLIRSRSSAAFQWLKANAARFGLKNLPSEPWHWSTSGK
ncbi:MAG TPA: M15 family metallopeptidase [Candidatus Nitrosotenuis sp.]|nr:M15 family metallopeptidase [Candidatus Nitrosotenuis sp.]